MKNKNNLNIKKLFSHNINVNANINNYSNLPVILEHFFYNKQPYHLIVLGRNFFYQQFKCPGIDLINPGNICNMYIYKLFQPEPKKLLGSCFSLLNVPYNSEICYLQNVTNEK
jgi:hypothetical protein